MNGNQHSSGSPPPGEPYPISFWEMVRVMLATLLVLFAGYFLVTTVSFFQLTTPEDTMQPEEAAERLANKLQDEGLAALPLQVKLLLMVVQAGLAVPAIIFLRRKRLSLRVFLRLKGVPWALAGYSIVIGFGVAVLGDELSRLVELISPMPERMVQDLTRMMQLRSFADLVTMGVTVALIAPLAEELLFRGFLQRYFEARHGVTTGVLWASALFAAYHFNIYWLIPILLMATIMGAMAWRAESVLPAVIVHGTNNTLGLVTVNTAGGEDPGWYTLGEHVHPLVLLVALAAMIWALRRYFRHAENAGLGGHGPGGGRGSHVNLRT